MTPTIRRCNRVAFVYTDAGVFYLSQDQFFPADVDGDLIVIPQLNIGGKVTKGRDNTVIWRDQEYGQPEPFDGKVTPAPQDNDERREGAYLLSRAGYVVYITRGASRLPQTYRAFLGTASTTKGTLPKIAILECTPWRDSIRLETSHGVIDTAKGGWKIHKMSRYAITETRNDVTFRK